MVPPDPPHNLPSRLTSFVGREREIAEITALLSVHRLVTLVGAPGVGKTRLSLQISANVLETFPDGVWLVELAPLADPDLVPRAVANVLGVREQPGRFLTAGLSSYLRNRRALLLLDNCEHLIGAAAALAETLLQGCQSLLVLATSREPLNVDGEVTYRVPSLSVSVAESEAVRLFVERARAAAPAFALTEQSAPVVSQICTRLDGIPLAIELAAARVRAFSVEQIAARLDDRFRLLTGGSRTALPRQQTLRGAVEWSYDLLSQPEQALLRCLAVFVGGFTLEAAEYIGDGGARAEERGTGGESDSASRAASLSPLETLASLVDRSLVQVEEGAAGERRYRLLETLRHFGLEKLTEHGELAAVRARHRDYFLAFAEEAAPRHNQRPDSVVFSRLELEHDNLRAVLVWCQDETGAGRGDPAPGAAGQVPPGPSPGLRLASAIWPFWWRRGHIGEGRRWLVQLLAGPHADTRPGDHAVRASALLGAAVLLSFEGGHRLAIAYMTDALASYRAAGDKSGVVLALSRLGFFLAHVGESARAIELCAQSVTLGRQVSDRSVLAMALLSSGNVARMLGRPEQSVGFTEEATSMLRQLGDLTFLPTALLAHSYALADLDDIASAMPLVEEALHVSREVGNTNGVAQSFKEFARFALFAGDVDRAIDMLHLALPVYQQLGDRWLISICLDILAGVKMLQGTTTAGVDAVGASQTDGAREHLLDAARLYAWSDLLQEQYGLVPPPELHGSPGRNVALLRERLGEAAFARAWGEGQAMSVDEVVDYALALTAPPASAVGLEAEVGTSPADPEVKRLTPREREVVVLIARGLTNRQIAGALVLSERTVDTHVHNILARLELRSRAQIAAWAVEHGLGRPR